MRVSTKVTTILQAENINGDELNHMLKHAAITSLRGFNRRFHHWLFKVQGSALVDMQYAEVVEVGSGDVRVMEDHEDCKGKGCRTCGWSGHFVRWVRDKEVPQHEPLRVNLYPSIT